MGVKKMMRADEAEKVIALFSDELRSIRAGRATPALVEGVVVEAYGANMPLKSLAAITLPDPRTILIEPWDAALMPVMLQALEAAQVGLRPVVDGRTIRLQVPPLTQERRKELARLVTQKTEETKVRLRKMREGERERILKEERAKNISQDEKFRQFKTLDKETDAWMEKVDGLRKKKEEEILQ